MPEYLIPLSLVFTAFLLAPRSLLSGPKPKLVALWVILCAASLVLGRYILWRLTGPLPLPGTGTGELVFYWALLAIEIAVWIDTAILFAMLSRPRDNSIVADLGETTLRSKASHELPTVDIFIATYNEDFDVLEKTILGAIGVEWPEDRRTVFVLDDGKRDWLAKYCASKGVTYLTRPDNSHAKAGNINAAIARTSGDFFMILDADFIPQKSFLYRAMGLFQDKKVGIVQIPHSFYNADPMQSNLGLRNVMPDDQRFFFDTIMAGRDGWGTAFCCGSNSITRRTAIESIGNALPTGSITEDMLLTLAMFRKGYVTRYLNERLAIGLAPESLDAMYIQRSRWARGAMQIMFLKQGPFGPGLKLRQRIMFIPLHWIVQPFMTMATLMTPMICLWTGWSPLPTASLSQILSFQIPALFAVLLSLRLIAPTSFFSLAATVHGALQVPRILPTVITTLIKPHGHAFKVTPKGSAAGGSKIDKVMIYLPAAIIVGTALGMIVNSDINTRIILDRGQIPLLAVWAVFSMIVLVVVQASAVSSSNKTGDEIFRTDTSCTFATKSNEVHAGRIKYLSMSSARIEMQMSDHISHNIRWLRLDIPGVGSVPAFVRYANDDYADVAFSLDDGAARNALIEMLFTQGIDNSVHTTKSFRIIGAMILRAFGSTKRKANLRPVVSTPPEWITQA